MTDSESGSTEDRLFHGALEIPAGPVRDEWIARACEHDPVAGDRLRALLRAHENFPHFMACEHPTLVSHPVELPGQVIGRYKLLQRIGEGGFGTVWMAEQCEPVIRRVALKLLKPGMDSGEIVARFEAERQALALMAHPNIAAVFDAGTSNSGRPFFVMELVKGIPITQFCDQYCLSTRQRLELFRDVCAALTHAHQKGIIHRDVKPSNILVTRHGEKAVVKVIDFGIAKALQGRLTENTLFTRFEQMLGTPAYMAPEQTVHSGLDVDTRSDIYSLGVLLYELLAGRPPFDAKTLASAGFDEMRRIIREVEPARPSTRVQNTAGPERAALAKARQLTPSQLSQSVPSDLDWIVMTAIDKDRDRRYATAEALSLDIGRFLADQPVTATPPSAAYRLRKLARRHRRALQVGAALVFILLAATVFSLTQAVMATRARNNESAERARAEDKAREAEEVLRFFQYDFIDAATPSSLPGASGSRTTLLEAIKAAESRLSERFKDRPQVEASLRIFIGESYASLGLDDAVPQLERGVVLRSQLLGSEHPDTLLPKLALAQAYANAGRLPEALSLSRDAHDAALRSLGETHRITMLAAQSVAYVHSAGGEHGKAMEVLEPVYLRREALLGSHDPKAESAYWSIHDAFASACYSLGRHEQALVLYETLYSHYLSRLGIDHQTTLHAAAKFAGAHYSLRHFVDAECLYEQLLPRQRRRLGDQHPDTLSATANLALCYREHGQTHSASRLLEEAADSLKRILGDEHPLTLSTLHNLANLYLDLGRLPEARVINEKLLAVRTSRLGPFHEETLSVGFNLALVHYDEGQTAKAVEELVKLTAIAKDKLGVDHPLVRESLLTLASRLREAKRFQEAVPYQQEGIDLVATAFGPLHEHTIQSRSELVLLLAQAGRPSEALPIAKELVDIATDKWGADHFITNDFKGRLAVAHSWLGELGEAAALLEEVVRRHDKNLGPEHLDGIPAKIDLAATYADLNRIAEAIALLENVVGIADSTLPTAHPLRSIATRQLALLYEGAGKEEAAAAARERLNSMPPVNLDHLPGAGPRR